jgi:hypothetical protein
MLKQDLHTQHDCILRGHQGMLQLSQAPLFGLT